MYVLDQKQGNKVYPCKPQFFYIKVGFNGGGGGYTFRGYVFLMVKKREFVQLSESTGSVKPDRQLRARIGLVSHQNAHQHTPAIK